MKSCDKYFRHVLSFIASSQYDFKTESKIAAFFREPHHDFKLFVLA